MKRKILVILALVVLGLSGCANKKVFTNSKKDTSVKNKIELSNVTYYDDKNIKNEYGDITLYAGVKNEMIDYEQARLNILAGLKDNKAIVSCDAEDGKRYIVFIDTDTKAAEIKMELSFDDYVTCKDSYIVIQHADYEKSEYSSTLYDYDLNEICHLDLDESVDNVFPDQNMEKVYYLKDNKLKYMALDDNKSYDVEIEYFDNVNYIYDYGVSNGREYLILDAGYDNGQQYRIMSDISTGEVVYLFNDTSFVYEFTNGHMPMTDYLDENKTVLYDYVDGDTGYKYVSSGEEVMTSYRILSDGRVLAAMLMEEEVDFYIFDKDMIVASSSVNIHDCLIDGGVLDSEEIMDIYIYSDIFELSEGNIVFSLGCGDYSCYFNWIPQEENITNEAIEISEFSSDELFLASDSEEILNYLPGELSEELKPLRERADDLENKYDIDIKIGEEGRGKYDDYLVSESIDYSLVSDSLERLDEQLGRYPDGFFKQFKNKSHNGLSVTLSGNITKTSNFLADGDQPSGFTDPNFNMIIVVVDIEYSYGFESIFNHEMSHAIESIIFDRFYGEDEDIDIYNEISAEGDDSEENDTDDYPLADDRWNQFNPKVDDIYTYDYGIYGYDKYEKYCSEWMGYDELYFTRCYGMTYPTEDRATIFEEVMTGSYCIDLDKATHIQDKLNYYCKCIRDSFDTTGWEDVPWEKYYNVN